MYSVRALAMAIVALIPVAGAFAAATDSPQAHTPGHESAHVAKVTAAQCVTAATKEDVTFVSCGGFF